MLKSRATTLVLGLVLLGGGLIAGAWHLFSRDDAEARARDPDARPEVAADGVEAPLVTPGDVRGARAPEMIRPWPFAQYLDVINRLRAGPAPENLIDRREKKVSELRAKLEENRFDIRMSNATANEVIERISSELAPHDARVFTREPHVPDVFRFEIDLRQATAEEVIEAMRKQCRDRVKWRVLTTGLVIGSERAVHRATSDSKKVDGRGAAEEASRSPSFAAATYRPDFENAHIGDVARDIEQRTGVTIVVGPELWRRAERITWRGKETSLDSVLSRIVAVTNSYWRVEDGRVFLLAP